MVTFAVYVKWLVVGLDVRGIYDCLLKSRVTSKKLIAFLFASIVICKCAAEDFADRFLYLLYHSCCCAKSYQAIIFVKANLVSANFFRKLT